LAIASFLLLGKFLHSYPIFNAAQHGTEHDHKNVAKLVQLVPGVTAGVAKVGKIGARCHVSRSTAKTDFVSFLKIMLAKGKAEHVISWLELGQQEHLMAQVMWTSTFVSWVAELPFATENNNGKR
jgi:hypothetical protein